MNGAWRAIVAALASGLIATGPGVAAESPARTNADDLRGGWVAEVDGTRHILILKVREEQVSGIYCAVDCSDPSHLEFVDRGTLGADGVRFEIQRNGPRGEARTRVAGRIENGRLILSLTPPRSRAATKLALQRDPRKPADITVEELFRRRGVESGPLLIAASPNPYVPPGPNELLTPAKLEGLWLWGTGPGKQHFIFRNVGGRVLGVACGPCDNPYSFAPLDSFVIRGDTATFDINHEDWGIGIEFGPFANHATVTLSRHELHLHTVAQNGSRTVEGDLTLIGPIAR